MGLVVLATGILAAHNLSEAIEIERYTQHFYEARVETVNQFMQDKMMYFRGPKNYDPDEIKVSPHEIVSAVDEYGYDLILLLSQAWCETRMCTTPRAKKTNSMFAVGMHDDGTNVIKYDTPDASIRPYIELMQNRYGITPERIEDIFSGRASLVNSRGERYATSTDYEKSLGAMYRQIKKKYPLLSMSFDEYVEGLENNDIQ
jgi:hypothetical protein